MPTSDIPVDGPGSGTGVVGSGTTSVSIPASSQSSTVTLIYQLNATAQASATPQDITLVIRSVDGLTTLFSLKRTVAADTFTTITFDFPRGLRCVRDTGTNVTAPVVELLSSGTLAAPTINVRYGYRRG